MDDSTPKNRQLPLLDSTPMKTCARCGESFPQTLEYFYQRPKGDWYSYCRKCRRKVDREWRQSNPEKVRKGKRRYYEAHKDQCLERSRLWYEENRDHALEQQREYHQAHIEEDREYGRAYYLANKDRMKEAMRQWHESNKDYANETSRQYYLANRERLRELQRQYREDNPDYFHEYARQYQIDNPDKFRISQSRRLARKRGFPSTLTDTDWQRALDYFNGCCAVCGRQLYDIFGTLGASADHWIPLNYDGDDNPGTVATNIVPLCHGLGGCNNKKHDIMPDVWLEREYGKRKSKQISARIEAYFEWVTEQLN